MRGSRPYHGIVNEILDQLLDRTVLFSYTKLGYRLRRGDFDRLPSMDGKRAVVTGATGGLGAATCRRLAELGAEIVVVARNEDKAIELVSELREIGPEASYELADLSLMSEVRGLAVRLSRLDRIDVLVNNAGALFAERAETPEGIERTFALNLLSQYLLTTELLPSLERSAPARVILVSSGGMYTQRLKPDDLEYEKAEFKGAAAYARTKRGQVVLAQEWARRWKDRGIVVHAMHPGWADTPGVTGALPMFDKLVGPLLRTPEEGADTIVYLAASDRAADVTGLFWLDRRPRSVHYLGATRETPEERREFMGALAAYADRTES